MSLSNKVAVVTGASSGIGRATAVMLAKEGARVVVNYLYSEAEAHKVVREIEELRVATDLVYRGK